MFHINLFVFELVTTELYFFGFSTTVFPLWQSTNRFNFICPFLLCLKYFCFWLATIWFGLPLQLVVQMPGQQAMLIKPLISKLL